MFVFAWVFAALATGVEMEASMMAPADIKANFDAMLKQLASMHKFMETEEGQKKELQVKKERTAVTAAKEAVVNQELKGELQMLQDRFRKVETSWVRTAVALSSSKKELAEKDVVIAQEKAENAKLREQLSSMAKDWHGIQRSLSESTETMALDFGKLNLTDLHLNFPDMAPKAPVLSPLFTPKNGGSAANVRREQNVEEIPPVVAEAMNVPVAAEKKEARPVPQQPVPDSFNLPSDFNSLDGLAMPNIAVEMPLPAAEPSVAPAAATVAAAPAAPAALPTLQAWGGVDAPIVPVAAAAPPAPPAAKPAAPEMSGLEGLEGLGDVSDDRILAMARAAGLDLQ